MAEIKEKEYLKLKGNLENMGNGTEKHKNDTEIPLPAYFRAYKPKLRA